MLELSSIAHYPRWHLSSSESFTAEYIKVTSNTKMKRNQAAHGEDEKEKKKKHLSHLTTAAAYLKILANTAAGTRRHHVNLNKPLQYKSSK